MQNFRVVENVNLNLFLHNILVFALLYLIEGTRIIIEIEEVYIFVNKSFFLRSISDFAITYFSLTDKFLNFSASKKYI